MWKYLAILGVMLGLTAPAGAQLHLSTAANEGLQLAGERNGR